MSLKIFVAGAAGVIGKRLVPLLVERGYEVHGTTRSPARASDLERRGARPIVLDAFDRRAVLAAVAAVRPQVLIHQLTDLSGGFKPEKVAETLARNSRLRTEGTQNLVEAARAAGVRRLIAQSIAWVYAPGREPHAEGDPLDRAAEGTRAVTVQGVVALEEAVLGAASPAHRRPGPALRLALRARRQREARRGASASCRRGGERGSPGHRTRHAGRLQHRRAGPLHRHRQGQARARVGSRRSGGAGRLDRAG